MTVKSLTGEADQAFSPATRTVDDVERPPAAGKGVSILELLNQPESQDIEFDPPRLGGDIFRRAALT
jgi:hypothetical protein